MPGGGVGVLRSLNERSVLTELMQHGPLTSLEIESRAGLSKPAVARMLVRVEQAGLAERVGTRPSPAGPPAQLWDIRPRAGLVAGVDVQTDQVAVMIVDIRGNVLARHTEVVGDTVYNPWKVLVRALRAASKAARTVLEDLDDIVLGLPGIIDPTSGHVLSSDRLPNWQGFNVASEMGKALRHEAVHVENDVNLVALAEQIHGVGRDVDSAVLLWIGAGIRIAIYRDGKLLRSGRGTVGEIAASIVPDPTGLDRFGRSGGALESLLAPRGILDLAEHHGVKTNATAADVLRRAAEMHATTSRDAERGEVALLDDFAECVAVGLSSPIGLLDPDVVVLAGSSGVAGGSALADTVERRLRALTGRSPLVRSSGLGEEAIMLGAVEFGLRSARERFYATGTAGIAD